MLKAACHSSLKLKHLHLKNLALFKVILFIHLFILIWWLMQFKFEIMIKIEMTKNFKLNMNSIIVSLSNLFS